MSVTVSIAQINPIVGRFRHNLKMIAEAIDTAKKENADVIMFPELALTAYLPENLLIRITKRAVGNDRWYPMTTLCRWNLT